MMVGQFGFAMGDASMAAVNLRMALMGVGNNIPFIVQGYAQVKKEAEEANMSVGKYIKSNMDASMKMVLTANLAMVALQVVPVVLNKINESSRRAAEEGLKKFNNELKTMSEMDVAAKIKDISDKIERFKGQLDVLSESSTPGSSWLTKLLFGDDYGNTQLKMFETMLSQLKDKQSQIDDQRKTRLGNLKADIDDYEAKIKSVSNTEIDADAKIQKLRDAQAAKQKEYNDLLMTTEEREKQRQADAEKQQQEIDKRNQKYDEYIQKIVTNYGLRKQLNEFENKSNSENIKSTLEIIDAELRHNQSLENQVKLLQLKKQLQDELKDQVDFFAESQDEMNKVMTKSSKQFNQNEKNSVEAIFNARQKYFESVKFLDRGYLQYKKSLVEMEAESMRQNGINETEIQLYKNNALKRLDNEYFDWRRQQIENDYKLVFDSLDIIEKGYDTFWSTLSDKEMSGHDRWQAILKAMETGFLEMLGNMIKNYLANSIMQAAISKAMQTESIASATATGSALAAAYAPAAAFASISSFGAADVAGSTGLASTVALSYLLAIPKVPGFKEGSMGLVGEKGPELIAPLDTYAEGQAKLITMTMMTLREEIESGNANFNSNSSEDLKAIKDELTSLKQAIIERPARAYLDDAEAKKIGNSWNSQVRRGRI